jgi:F-type H+-transporting ATPase subunit alpha
MTQRQRPLEAALLEELDSLSCSVNAFRPALSVQETGTTLSVRRGIAQVGGLPNVRSDELVSFSYEDQRSGPSSILGIAFNLDPEELGVVLLGDGQHICAGDPVVRTGRVVEVPVGDGLLGRTITALGEPLDGLGDVSFSTMRPIEREAPAILERAAVTVPLQTGWKVVDALIPIGRGQRELIIGDRQTGKTLLAVDAILNQKDRNVVCIYCAIGQRSASIANVIATLSDYGAMEYSIVVVASGQDSPGLQYVTPYAATTMGEYFMEMGRDVLIVYDDLTHHARTYRELSLLLRRTPGREAYPGDIFYLHSRLLERATHLSPALGGGSLTALPIIETQAQNISAYVPTNLISITDGQIYLSSDLFRKGIFPAVDVGRSVSRVGSRTQLAALREISPGLRLAYAQYQEIELFTRFGTQLDSGTRDVLRRGRRIRDVLRQGLHNPLSVPEQVTMLFGTDSGLFDELPEMSLESEEASILSHVRRELASLYQRIEDSEPLSVEDREALSGSIAAALADDANA